jgi:hypothetical protein
LLQDDTIDFTSANNTHFIHNSIDLHIPSLTLSLYSLKPLAFSFYDNSALDSNILDTPVLVSPTTSTQGIFSPDISLWEDLSSGQFVDRTAEELATVERSGKAVKVAQIEPVGRAV